MFAVAYPVAPGNKRTARNRCPCSSASDELCLVASQPGEVRKTRLQQGGWISNISKVFYGLGFVTYTVKRMLVPIR